MKDGILNIYKEQGMTSFAVVAKLRSALKVKKIGHTGTLDPDATGVLPVCIGKATKLVELLSGTDKVYKAVMLLGVKTDTQDSSGTVLETCEYEIATIREKMLPAFQKWTGQIEQVPPMYSALKVGGVKLVDAARKGQVIERKARPVTIYHYENISLWEDGRHISFEVRCSKGTYIRTLCEDLGAEMGVFACLESLERTEASGLCAADAVTLKEVFALLEAGKLEEKLLPIDSFLTTYDSLTVAEAGLKKVMVGNFLYGSDLGETAITDGCYRIYDEAGRFLALYRFSHSQQCLKPEKMFI